MLNNTKITAQEVNEKLANASETNAKIAKIARSTKVALQAALIYFLIAEFASVNVMYQASLKQFSSCMSSPSITPSPRRCPPSASSASSIT